MNKKLRVWFQLIILCLGVFLPFLAGTLKAQAAELNDVITEMHLTTNSGEQLTNGVDIWQTFRVYAKFALPDNQAHAGDTTVIHLPNEFTFGNSSAIELKDENGALVANGVLDSNAKTITLTYTDYVEQKSSVRGEFFFYSRIDHEVVTEERDIPATFTVGNNRIPAGSIHYNGPPKKYESLLEKSAFQWDADAKNEIRYNVAINRNMGNYKNVSVTDKLGDTNAKIVQDSVRVYKVSWRWNNGDWARDSTEDVTADFQSKMTFGAEGDSLTINFGDVEGFGYLVEYKTLADYDLADGEVVGNKATMNYNNTETVSVTNEYSYQIAGGKSEGYNFKVKVHKTDESNASLSGAVFEVVRKATNKVVGTITTDADGNAEVGNLLRDTYILRETTSPAGYDRLTEDITISPTDFGKTLNVGSPASGDSGDSRLVAVNVVNKQTQTPTDKQVTFSKVNLAGEEIAGAQIQIFKGQESKGSPVASWTSEADQSKEINLEPGVYTFHEEAAPTGYLAVTDIVFQVNEDGTVTVLDANSNAVEYTDGKLFITDQAAPAELGTPDKAVQGGIKPNQSSDSDKAADGQGKSKKVLPATGSAESLGLVLAGLVVLTLLGLYRKTRLSK